MRLLFLILAGWLLIATANAQGPEPLIVDLNTSDGITLKASYFAAAKPGPGVLLFHQNNRTRDSWRQVARQLAAVGINTLAVDHRGYGDSGGAHQVPWERQQADLEVAFQFLISEPGVLRNVVGVAGAGSLGVIDAVETARAHIGDIKSLIVISGETFRSGIEFLHEASHLPELFVVADSDEYPPTVEAMLWLYARASSPSRKLIYYATSREAPWVWYETRDASKVAATGGHGTDLFRDHVDLPGTIVQWFVTTLITTPGHAPADPLAAAAILNQLAVPGGARQARQQLIASRKTDVGAQLWPEISASIIGNGYLREHEIKAAIEVFQLNLFAYPDSADAHDDLADAYLADGRQDLAHQYAAKTLAMIDAHATPLSSWSDTEQRRAEVRRDAQEVFEKTAAGEGGAMSQHAPGSVFSDCPDCPQMVVIPAGRFTMGSSSAEKSWAAAQVGSAEGVADESPEHTVSLRSFAMGKDDVTRGEYAKFVRETARSAADGCGRDSFEWKKQPNRSWENPGFKQTDRDPVVCVSWQDAQAYIAWLNGKVRPEPSLGNGPYRLPSESEWEYAARGGRSTRFWWGDDATATSEHAWYKANSGGRTHPVGLKRANDFGLHDMVGNVWQWTQDCYDKSYASAPTDGGANESQSADPDARDSKGACLRVDRGGSWMFRPWALRSATRERNPADYRDAYMGFRVVRSLP